MISIVDTGMGNLQSVRNAFEAIGADVGIADSPQELDTVTAGNDAQGGKVTRRARHISIGISAAVDHWHGDRRLSCATIFF